MVVLSIRYAQGGDSSWNVDAAGIWSTAGNWTPGIPGATSGTANADICIRILQKVRAWESVSFLAMNASRHCSKMQKTMTETGISSICKISHLARDMNVPLINL